MNAIENVLARTSTDVEGESISRIRTIFYLAGTLIKWPYVIIFGIALVYVIVTGLKQMPVKKNLLHKKRYQTFALFILIALFPCVWFFVTANHSYIHPRLVYRNWGITLFAVFAGFIDLFQKKE